MDVGDTLDAIFGEFVWMVVYVMIKAESFVLQITIRRTDLRMMTRRKVTISRS